MSLGIGSLLREARVLRELLAFAGDTVRRRHVATSAAASKPVLLIPGFMASDTTLYPIAARLRMTGHPVFFAGIWFNADCPGKTIKRLERSLVEASHLTGSKTVVIGHSLGGIYARELARRFPLLVERAILLGSPLKDPAENSNYLVMNLVNLMRLARPQCLVALDGPCEACGMNLPGKSPRVPVTIIYTKTDGVVNWRSCLETGPNVEAVEVRSSHCGLAVSPQAWDAIAARLGKPATRRPVEHHRRAGGRYRLFRFRPQIARIPAKPGAKAARRPMINGVEIVDHLQCGICGSHFISDPAGDKTLGLYMGAARRRYFFCKACGENVVGRVESEHARKRYVWYWAVPLEENRASDGAA